ncbi:MAG: response regulator transcription factor [Candidatus Moraniibacteriota bacterium]
MKHSSTRILLIDDEPAIAETLAAYARKDGMDVEYAKDGEIGLDLIGRRKFDVVVVDWMLPGISGPEIVKTIRGKSDIPILMISARDEESDIVVGLELGADDYVTKPFGARELMARIKASLRRGGAANREARKLNVDGLEFCFETMEFSRNGSRIVLTPNEFRIFRTLYENRGKVVSRESLMERTLGNFDYLSDRTLDTHVRNLRHKLEEDPRHPMLIETVRETGFKFRVA